MSQESLPPWTRKVVGLDRPVQTNSDVVSNPFHMIAFWQGWLNIPLKPLLHCWNRISGPTQGFKPELNFYYWLGESWLLLLLTWGKLTTACCRPCGMGPTTTSAHVFTCLPTHCHFPLLWGMVAPRCISASVYYSQAQSLSIKWTWQSSCWVRQDVNPEADRSPTSGLVSAWAFGALPLPPLLGTLGQVIFALDGDRKWFH